MELLEGVAAGVLSAAGLGGVVDAYELTLWANCEVRMGRPGMRPCLLGRTIVVAPDDPPERQRFAAVHELGHLLLRERGIDDSEWNVNWLASALLHPRAWFLARLDAHGWDLHALRRDFQWSSYEALGRRAVNVDRAVLWVCDRNGAARSSRRVRSSGLDARLARPTALERRLVQHAAASLAPQRHGLAGAWPLPRGNHLRVISLAPATAIA
jgi:hypothetical protein